MSFAMFWVFLGPTVYWAYAKNELYSSQEESHEVEDKYAEILVKQKERKQDDSKITFDEYEQFLARLEKQNKLDALASQNPKEIRLRSEGETHRRLEMLKK